VNSYLVIFSFAPSLWYSWGRARPSSAFFASAAASALERCSGAGAGFADPSWGSPLSSVPMVPVVALGVAAFASGAGGEPGGVGSAWLLPLALALVAGVALGWGGRGSGMPASSFKCCTICRLAAVKKQRGSHGCQRAAHTYWCMRRGGCGWEKRSPCVTNGT